MSARLLFLAASLALATLLVSCDREGRVRAEARMFLALYEATDHRSPIPERQRKIKQLEALSLTEESVRAARDQCVAAHRSLISAEQSNDRAGAQLERALAAQPTGDPLPVAETESIRTGIERAERALGEARGSFEKCEAQARDLSLHHQAR